MLTFGPGCLLLLIALSQAEDAAPADQQAAFEITQADLDRLSAELNPLVARELGANDRAVKIRLASVAEVRERLFAENQVLMAHQIESQALVDETASQFAGSLAPFLLAKYDLGEGQILVVPRNFRRLAKLLLMPELLEPVVLKALLVHELVHAFDDSLYGMGDTLMSLDDANRVSAMNAIIEGHAQHIARRICTAQGWQQGFDHLTRAILKSPVEDEESPEAYLQKLNTANLVSYYEQGEKFISAVEQLAGVEAVTKMIRSPPLDMAAIYEPAWALDPSSRPRARYALPEAMQSGLVSYNEEDGWIKTPVPISKAQLLSAISILGKGVGEQAVHSITRVKALMCTSSSPGNGQITLAMLEFPSPAEAIVFGEMNESALRAKEKLFVMQGLELKSNSYATWLSPGFKGLINRKTIVNQGIELCFVTLIGQWESLCIEFSFIEREVKDEELGALAMAILESSKRLLQPLEAEK